MQAPDIIKALRPVVAEFERLGIRYYVGGSVASSAYGMARSTADVDVVAELGAEHVDEFSRAVNELFYVSRPMIESAVQRRSCFNIIFNETSSKVDIFVSRDRAFDKKAMSRTRRETIPFEDAELQVYMASPEDIILCKLEWYRLSDEVLQRQVDDIVGIMKVQRGLLDSSYLDHWARELGVGDLLEKVIRIAGG